MKPVLIDTDPAMGTLNADPEDGLAIALALASPELDVKAITCTQGNVPVEHAYANARHLLELVQRQDIPVAAGRDRPMLHSLRPAQMSYLEAKRKADRLFPLDASEESGDATQLIAQTCRRNSGLTVVCIGPLTNLAVAILSAPDLVQHIGELIVMGGAYRAPGNVSSTAEFNFWMDPEAAQLVLGAGLDPLLVGLDVCTKTALRRADVDATHVSTPFGRLAQASCDPCFGRVATAGPDGLHLYDSLTVAAAVDSRMLSAEPAYVRVDTSTERIAGTALAWIGDDWPWSRRPVPGETNARVALDLDGAAFERLFRERVLARL